jgi:NitT/TauT family transport system ATP-binding protein
MFVTHSVAEAVFLSERIVVMSPRPGRLETVVEVDLGHPRGAEIRDAPEFFRQVSEVRHHLREVDSEDR